MKKILLIFMFLKALISYGEIIPIPFITQPVEIQKLTKQKTRQYFSRELFGQCYGIDVIPLRNCSPDSIAYLTIVSDKRWHRLIYGLGVEKGSNKEGKWLKAFGGGDSHENKFLEPLGVAIDRAVYQNNQNNYYVYVADKDANRIVRLKYNAIDSSLTYYDTIGYTFLRPTDVASEISSLGGSYLVVADAGNNRIVIFRLYSDGTYLHLKNYGSDGSGIGQFCNPSGVSITRSPNNPALYDIYVCDTDNRRLVYLQFDTTSSAVNWISVFTDETNQAEFLSVASNCNFSVYVTDKAQSRIWVFTPGLTQLIYTFGNGQFNAPRDVVIYRDELAVTEEWTDSSGIQYFRIVPEIKDYNVITPFDATVESTKIHFRLLEIAAHTKVWVQGINRTIADTFLLPGDYDFYWDGRDNTGKIVLPGNYTIKIRASFKRGELNPSLIINKSIPVRVKGTRVSGNVAGTWSIWNSPYVLMGDINVSAGSVLTIQPGVYVMPTGNYEIKVYGSLKANGTKSAPILFSPYRKIKPVPDSTYPGFWKNIDFYSGTYDSLVLNHCIIEYGGGNPEDSGMVDVHNKNTRITNSKIRYSAKYGVYFDPSADYPIVLNNTFAYNGSYPLLTWASKVPEVINNNVFINNGIQGLRVKGERISQSAFWKRCDSVWFYDIISSIDVYGSGDTIPILQIDSGVTLRFKKNADLDIGGSFSLTRLGKLIANGTPTKPIIFTGLDTIYYDNFWDGITLRNGDRGSYFKNCRITFTQNHGINILTDHLVTIENSIIRKSRESGIRLSGYSGVIRYNQIGENLENGIEVDGTAPSITNNYIYKNRMFGITVNGISSNHYISGNIFSENESLPINRVYPDSVHQIIKTNTFVNNKKPGIRLRGGKVTKDAYWYSPEPGWIYYIDDNIEVYKEKGRAVLTIEAGTTLKFDEGEKLIIGDGNDKNKGALKAIGRPGPNKIIFTAQDQGEYWGGLYFNDGTDDTATILKYCLIEKGGKHYSNGNIEIERCSPTIERCEIRYADRERRSNGIRISRGNPTIRECYITNNGRGIYTDNSNTTPYIYKSLVKDNKNGIICDLNTFPIINYCNIESNDSFGVVNLDDDHSIDARYNWWGHPTGPRHKNNSGGQGDSVSDYVNYSNFSHSPYEIIPAFDVSAESIISPKGVLYLGSLVEPKGVVKNYFDEPVSFTITMKIGNVYINSKTINLEANNTYTVTFDTCQLPKGVYPVFFYTSLAGDEVTSNDTIIDTITVKLLFDAAADKIIAPTGTVIIDSLIKPIGVVKNNYDSVLTYSATMKIGDFYMDLQISEVNGLSVDTIEFSTTDLKVGTHNITFKVHLDGDENNANDSLLGSVKVIAGDYWKFKTPPKSSVARLAAENYAGYIYAAERDTCLLYRYNIAANLWDENIASLLKNHKGADYEAKKLYLLGYPQFPGSGFRVSGTKRASGKDEQAEQDEPVIYSYNPSGGINPWAVVTESLPVQSVGNGSGIIVTDTTKIYLIEGQGTANIYWYDVLSDSWYTGNPAPLVIDSFGSFDWDRSDWIYALSAEGHFLRYSISKNFWEVISPSIPIRGIALAFDCLDKKLYVLTDNFKFFEYDLVNGSWVKRCPPPIRSKKPVALVYENGRVYAIIGKGNFLEYTPPPRRDAKPVEILSPKGNHLTEYPVIPSGIVANNFDSSLTFTVRMKIGDFYSQQKIVTLEPLTIDTVSFGETFLEPGQQRVVFYTNLFGDERPTNDTLIDSINVIKSNYWERKADPPFAKGKIVWDYGRNIYAANLHNEDLWRYDITNDLWHYVSCSPFRHGHIGMSLRGDFIYLLGNIEQAESKSFLTGSDPQILKDKPNDFVSKTDSFGASMMIPAIYSYDIRNNIWSLVDSSLPVKQIGDGSALISTDLKNLYLVAGQSSPSLYCYDIAKDSWYQKASAPFPISPQAASCWNGEDVIYVLTNDFAGHRMIFLRYWLNVDTWDTLPSRRLLLDSGCALTYDIFKRKIYTFTGNSQKFLEYDIVESKWKQMMPVRSIVKYGSALAYADPMIGVPSNGFVYALTGDGFFWQYTPPVKGEDFQPGGEGVMGQPKRLPITFALFQNLPNPFVNNTVIKWQTPIKTKVNLKIFDITGRIVKVLINQEKEPGYYITNWDGTDNKGKRVPNGIYFLDFRAEKFHKNIKVILMK